VRFGGGEELIERAQANGLRGGRCKDRNGTFAVETTAWEGSGGVRS
jgi:hypothetical protein